MFKSSKKEPGQNGTCLSVVETGFGVISDGIGTYFDGRYSAQWCAASPPMKMKVDGVVRARAQRWPTEWPGVFSR